MFQMACQSVSMIPCLQQRLGALQDVYDSAEAGAAGISQVPCIELRTQHENDPTWKDIPDNFRHLQPDELQRFSRMSEPFTQALSLEFQCWVCSRANSTAASCWQPPALSSPCCQQHTPMPAQAGRSTRRGMLSPRCSVNVDITCHGSQSASLLLVGSCRGAV